MCTDFASGQSIEELDGAVKVRFCEGTQQIWLELETKVWIGRQNELTVSDHASPLKSLHHGVCIRQLVYLSDHRLKCIECFIRVHFCKGDRQLYELSQGSLVDRSIRH